MLVAGNVASRQLVTTADGNGCEVSLSIYASVLLLYFLNGSR